MLTSNRSASYPNRPDCLFSPSIKKQIDIEVINQGSQIKVALDFREEVALLILRLNAEGYD